MKDSTRDNYLFAIRVKSVLPRFKNFAQYDIGIAETYFENPGPQTILSPIKILNPLKSYGGVDIC